MTNPQHPTMLGTFKPHPKSYINNCIVNSNKLYISDIIWNEITSYDITNPQSPVHTGSYACNLGTESMCIVSDKLYTANGIYGLGIHNLQGVDIDDAIVVPAPELVLSSYPNPFHSGTSIEFSLPKSEHVKLSLYNLKGQLVRELCDENKQVGSNTRGILDFKILVIIVGCGNGCYKDVCMNSNSQSNSQMCFCAYLFTSSTANRYQDLSLPFLLLHNLY